MKKQIFFPLACKAAEEAKIVGNRFAYYTTAEVAFSVAKYKRIWMRSTTTMNDYLELQYGRDMLLEAMRNKPGEELEAAVESCHAGLFEEVWKLVTAWIPGFLADTFITCISQHLPEEDVLGRLSMWRAYGGKTGVALVFNGAVFDLQTDALGAYSSPVAYLNKEQFFGAIKLVASNIVTNRTYVASLPRDVVKNTLFTMFRFAVLCTKHPGFSEEKEWRIVASPALHQSALLESDVAVVRGVPQPILKIPLENFPEFGVTGLALPEIINRIIIGPCEFPHVTFRALWLATKQAGVEDPASLIIQSHIPLRHA